MSKTHSKAATKRWENVTPEEKSRRMSAIAKQRQAKMTLKQRRALSVTLLMAKRNKVHAK